MKMSIWTFTRWSVRGALLAIVSAFAMHATHAADGEIMAPGGGIIKYTGAESVTTVPGTTDILIKFLGEGSYELPGMTMARILAIGGGGGGGGTCNSMSAFSGNYGGGGGGGAGGFVETNGQFSAALYTISVGQGGAGSNKGSSSSKNYVGTDGGDTIVSIGEMTMITAYGGGGGGGQGPGNAGASGGGGSMKNSGAVVNEGGAVLDEAEGQGSAGGSGNKGLYGGGGGGAGGVGGDASTLNPTGGVGRVSNITGSDTWYAGGGGGGWSDKTITSTMVPEAFKNGIPGGQGGGGRGGVGRSTGITPAAGEDGTGGGGGGCNANSGSAGGAAGGCGVVYVRISASIPGALTKPKSRTIEHDGEAHLIVEENPFYTIDGENSATDVGVHAVQVTPIEGVEWEGGGREAVTVTLTITEEGAFSGTATVTGAPVSFEGVTGTNWVNGDLILQFTGAGTFTLPGTSQARILAVGGGGGGGGTCNSMSAFTGNYGGGGGGGAGGFVETNGQLGAAVYAVSVGLGGLGSSKGSSSTKNYVGSDGGDTTVLINGSDFIKAYGGGGGGGQGPGNPGGSGGGGSMKNSGAVVNTGGEPLDSTQGHAGGAGDKGLYGGGGGGAGGAGGDASTLNPTGGVGRVSDIVGTNVWYAGGGGGGWTDKTITSSKVPEAFANGVPGGLGGGGSGGVGRSTGIVPTAGTPRTGGGGGGCNANSGSAGGAAGGSGVVYVRISTAMEGEFKKPTDPSPIFYDENAHTSVVNTAFYTVSGQNVGTDVGTYVAHVTLKPGTTWPEGGNEDVDVTMKIVKRDYEISDLHLDDWEFGTDIEDTPEPTCSVAPAWVAPRLIYEYASQTEEDWGSVKPTEKGTYRVRVRVGDGEGNFNLTNPEQAVTTFRITPIRVEFTNLALRDWMFGTPTDETPEPTCTVNRDDVLVVYEYGKKGEVSETGEKTLEGWSADKPTAVGKYVVRVRAPDFDNYEFDIKYADFEIVNGLAELFTDWVKITIAGLSGEKQEKYPFLITLKEDDPVGFLHERAGVDGETLAVTDAAGTALPYKVISWNESGVSTLRVCLPELGSDAQTIMLYWHLRDGRKAPEHDYTPTTPAVAQPGSTFDLVMRDGLRVNYWISQPKMSKTAWESGETPGTLTTPGELAESLPVLSVVNSFTGESRAAIPTDEVGAFRLTFTPEDPRHVYEPLSTFIDIRITGNVVVDNLRGTAGDETLNGRVLLANDDEAAGHVITGQGWWQTNVVDGVAYDTYWDHGTETHRADSYDYPYIRYGVNHTLRHINEDETTNIIWRLKDVLIGNQFIPSNRGIGGFSGVRAYLPWSATSHGISSKAVGEKPLADKSEVGNLLLRNRENAAIYSPCYSDGIGTIYFDVTRGDYNGDASCYQIVVEVATETAAGEPPTDENSRAKTGESVFPDLGGIGDAQWVAQTIMPLKKDNSAREFVPQAATKALNPSVSSYGTSNNFYRVYVPVNVRGAARFRIRRTATVTAGGATPYNDLGGFVVIDNVIVSYPQMTAKVESYGIMDTEREKTPRLILGQEASMTVPFPAVGATDVRARARPIRETSGLTNINEKSLIPLVRMHYRWRYLDQTATAWQTTEMSPANNFISDSPLTMPAQEGDLEYWFENETQVPYYEYFDYTGTGLCLTNSGYSEAVGTVTNRIVLGEGGWLPSGGTDWFFRLRQGTSDYESIRLTVRDTEGIGLGDQSVDFELTGNHVWRCFLRTPTNVTGKVLFRMEALNLQTPGAETFETNRALWKLASDAVSIGGLGKIEDAAETDWTTLTLDDKAGYVMMQIDDRPTVRSFVVVHGDRQDFNLWSDANKKDGKGLFVGQYELDGADPTGSSGRTREFYADITNWHASVAVDTNYWRESFAVDKSQIGPGKNYPLGEPFAKATTVTPNGWVSGPGQWAAGFYNDPATGLALQMQGQGYGFMQFADAGHSPRGLRSISFTARLAQNQSFDDVCYWDDSTPVKTKFHDYTFVAKGAFDMNEAKSFAGAGSVSLLAYYRAGVGCYEFRITQKAAVMAGDVPTGPGSVRTLQLYRWAPDAKQQMKATALGDAFDVNLTSMNATKGETTSDFYPMLFISCSNTTDNATIIWAGVSRNAVTPGTVTAADSAWVIYKDADAQRLTSGTFGVTSCSCPARFCYPFWYDKPVGGKSTPKESNKVQKAENGTPTWRGTRTECVLPIRNGEWAMAPDRFEYAMRDSAYASLVGFRARTVPQAVEIYTAPKGTTSWNTTPIDTFEVSGFGASGTSATNVVRLYSTDDCSVKIQMGGTILDPRCDVVIDDVQIEQWRGESFDDTEGAKYFPQIEYGSPSNFVFTTAWINGNGSVKLSAKRTTAAAAASLRTPLNDGQGGRGIGLGMFGFAWANAQENARLVVQVMTNETDIGGLAMRSKSISSAYWQTVTNIDFAAMSAADRASGRYSLYLGLHGVAGAVRVAVDPALVGELSGVTDESRFGEVDILSMTCSDEPSLDERSWWGWNLRTTDEGERRWLGDQWTRTRPAGGMSLGLNNAIDADVRTEFGNAYPKHLPFLQTPTMSENLIGEISFRARKYDTTSPSGRERTFVTLYGASAASAPDAQWTRIVSWEVTDDTYRTYSHRLPQGLKFATFRLAVVGVESVESYMPGGRPSEVTFSPLRVLIDEVTVSESVDARVAFRNVRPFRNHLDDSKAVPDIMSRDEQPLCKEAFGVQAEVYAAQLGDEIDLSEAKVRLWWYEGNSPWGFMNWKDHANAKNAWLAESSDTKGVFRSSYLTCPTAVIPMQNTPRTVQYMLEVVWRAADGSSVNTNWLESVDWEKPEWYDPLDLNRDSGTAAFSAYTILDTVAPGWAWINELNVFGTYDMDWNNSDATLQFVEIAAPGDADLTDWQIRFVDAQTGSDRIITNEVARFGDELPGRKAGLVGMDDTSKFVFHVVVSPKTFKAQTLRQDDGRMDGTWRMPTDTRARQPLSQSGEISSYYPLSVQLVRPSGIIEHEITCIGTNYYWLSEKNYRPEVHVEYLNERGGNFVYVGEDCRGTALGQAWSRSLGVHAGNGGIGMSLAESIANYWNATNTATPGRLNGTQVISADWPRPLGSSIIIYSMLDGAHLRQTFGGLENTNATVTMVFKKGDENGTNILYHADRWYALGEVKANGKTVTATETAPGSRTYTLPIAKYASNDITVVAKDDIDHTLQEKYGLGADNRYREAVMAWLTKGTDLAGRAWHGHDSQEAYIGLADYVGSDGVVVTNLDLTAMYWLDIDPTWEDHVMRYQAYYSQPPIPFETSPGSGVTNVTMKVFMKIENTETGDKWAPYVLQSATPGVTSWDYAAGLAGQSWGDVSFKVTGLLANGKTQDTPVPRSSWLPLRWFVFAGELSAGVPTSTSFENFESEIEIVDPYTKASPGYTAGWYDWVKAHGWVPVYWAWDIDDRLRPDEVEILKVSNLYQH